MLRKNTPQNVVFKMFVGIISFAEMSLKEERDSTVGSGYLFRLRKVWAEQMAQQLEYFLLFHRTRV